MAKSTPRIRWTEDERNTVLVAYRRLRTQYPKRDVAPLFAAAQKQLPAKRRRTLDYKLHVWLDSDSKRVQVARPAPNTTAVTTASPVAAPAAATKRRKGAPAAKGATVSLAAAVPALQLSRPRPTSTTASAPPSAALAQVMVEKGSEIVADILGSPQVQQALRALLRAAWPTTASEAPTREQVPRAGVDPTVTVHGAAEPGAKPTPPANGKLRVLIAGMEQREGAALAKTYDDTLELACWSAEDGVEQLPAAVERADVVVGMVSLLTQPVEQTLRRHARRYLRNARGVAGLRSELAGLALAGHGSAAVADT